MGTDTRDVESQANRFSQRTAVGRRKDLEESEMTPRFLSGLTRTVIENIGAEGRGTGRTNSILVKSFCVQVQVEMSQEKDLEVHIWESVRRQ